MKKVHEIILYYKYTAISQPGDLVLKQRRICESLGLKGRIIIAPEGINGTLEGTKENIDKYCKDLLSQKEFKDIKFKRSEGTGNAFPKLKIKARSEIVSAHLGDEDVNPAKLTGKYISAEELDRWLKEREDIHIVDMRNQYEYKIGRFENSIDPGMKNFRDLPEVTKKLEHLKDKTVVTVCTGGVRCEKASGYLVKKGFKDVYQLQDGIVTYMEKYPNEAFKGKLYVFDNRIAMDFDTKDNHTVVGKCDLCGETTENYVNCRNPECNAHFLSCKKCQEEKDGFCSDACRKIIQLKKVFV